MYIQRRSIIVNVITLRINDDDNKLLRDYAKANNITISDLVRNSVLEKIEACKTIMRELKCRNLY